MLAGLRPSSDSNDNGTTSGRRDRRGFRGRLGIPIEPPPGPARAPGAPRARRLVDQRRPRGGEIAGRPPRDIATRPRRRASGRIDRRRGRGRGRGARVRQLQTCRFVVAPRPDRGHREPARRTTRLPTWAAASGSRSSSCPPTRPARCTWATAGSGSYGDALGRVMSRCGWDVRREYYVNDTGGQIRLLGESLLARRRGDVVPGGGLPGRVRHPTGSACTRGPTTSSRPAGSRRGDPRRTSERHSTGSTSISTSGTRRPPSRRAARSPRRSSCSVERGLVYEEDGAIWLRSTEVGDTRDRVLIRSNGDAHLPGRRSRLPP